MEVTFLPPTIVMPEVATGLAALDAMFERMRRSGRLRLSETDRELDISASCAEEPSCLRQLSVSSGAQKVIAVKIAQLGEHQIIRVALIDAVQGASQKTWQEELTASTPIQLIEVMERIGVEVTETLVPPLVTPWYDQTWVRISVAAVLVTGLATAALLTRDRDAPETEPPIVISPP